MTKQADRVVLDRYDGRDTSFVAVERPWLLAPARPVLHWLAMGEVEPFDVWLRMDLSWQQADEFVASPPTRYDRYVSEQVGRKFALDLRVGNHHILTTRSEVRAGRNAVKRGLDEMSEQLGKLAASHRPHADRAREVNLRIPKFA